MKMLRKKNYIKFILPLVGLIIFLLPKIAHADIFGIADSFWGYIEMVLDAFDFFDNTILKLFWNMLIFSFATNLILSFGCQLLGVSMYLPINLNNSVVLTGWNFCRDIANIFIILILALIAITYIFRMETFGGKRALVRLIVVALLINFSLLFVGAGVDITNIIIRGIKFNIDFLFVVIILYLVIQYIFWQYFTLFSIYLAVALIPIANIGSIVAIITLFITPFVIGGLIYQLLTILLGLVIGLVFLFIGILFLYRIVMIWILAILSPLAFLCWILPQTRKYWDQWFKLLIQWLTWGILAAFFVGLGTQLGTNLGGLLSLAPYLAMPICVSGFCFSPAVLLPYLFLLIYFGVIYYFVLKKYPPEMADFLIGSTRGIISRGISRVGAPLARGYKEMLKKGYKGLEKGSKQLGKQLQLGKRYERFVLGQKMRERAGERPTGFKKLLAAPGSFYYRMRRMSPEEMSKKQVEEATEKFKSLSTDALRRKLPKANDFEKAAIMGILAEKRQLTDNEQRYVQSVARYGGDINKVLKARPDWALWAGKDPREIIEKMTPDEVTKIQPEALRKLEVIANMDATQIRMLARRGTREQKNAIVSGYQTERANLKKKCDDLMERKRNAATQEESDKYERERRRLEETMAEIEKNPNFYTPP